MSHEEADLQHRIPEMRLDVESPNLARMYDYMLGGAANFAVDRAAAAFHHEFPWIDRWARANRAFLVRAVRPPRSASTNSSTWDPGSPRWAMCTRSPSEKTRGHG